MINITGVSDSRVAPVAAYVSAKKTQSIIVVPSDVRARRLASDLSFFAKDREVIALPTDERFFLRFSAKSNEQMLESLRALKALRTGQHVIVIVPVLTAMKRLIPHRVFEEKVLRLGVGEEVHLDDVKKSLTDMGYERIEVVEARGQFSIRGGIVDIFTPDADNPYRIELFGTEIDSIRNFDIDTQRSKENLKYVQIYPAEQLLAEGDKFRTALKKIREAYTRAAKNLEKKTPGTAAALERTRDELCEYIENVSNLQLLENYVHYFYDDAEYIWDYMTDGNVMVDDPDRVREVLSLTQKERYADFDVLLERGQAVSGDIVCIPKEEDMRKLYALDDVTVFTSFPKRIQGIDNFDDVHNLQSRQMLSFNGKMDLLESELKSYVKRKFRVTIVCSTEERRDNLKEFIDRCDLTGLVNFELGTLSSGVEFPGEKLCYISEKDIFPVQKKPRKRTYKDKGQKITSFSDMKPGDYVVHENYGIGRFLAVEQLRVLGEKRDYIKIKYAGEDMLYVPVEQMDIVQKYIGGDDSTPRINRLSGSEWKSTKAKAKSAIAVMAKDLIDLYAERKVVQGYGFGPDSVWQQEFEDSFPYQETDDQLRSIDEIKADMEKPYIMDRLLCGDVGFGKTEVAARALFKCVSEGKQAAVLVPTTLLANQHYYTLKERFEKFPFKVEVLSRFRSAAQQSEIVAQLEKGQVDLVIGTHRLLSKDVKFKDLGLLVVDEEQRFGVEHKETLKKLKSNVDVLTLSATPIPRTLNMSLTGIKDMSLIEEPPEERYPVQTYVLEQDEQLITEIIQRELGRGGQVFVVFNRVRGIQQVADKISALVPEANVIVGHGQMKETTLENIMMSFIDGENDVLVATTIIESGIDIPNANTMIIMDADRYGLSQLYQLRGRVGRSNRMAYAYLMYQKNKVLTEVAEKRLKAIKEFTEFGAGFKVAMRDLEIRGAGNLLGREQSGHMMNIGYELYCKMLDDAVRALQGEIVNDAKEETSVEIPVSAYIPDTYIENEVLKLQMYKKIAAIHTYDDEGEIYDELTDRFGDVPDITVNLLKISHIRYLAGQLSIKRIHVEKSSAAGVSMTRTGKNVQRESRIKLIFEFAEKNPITPLALFELSEKYGQTMTIYGGSEPCIKLSVPQKNMLPEALAALETIAAAGKSPEAAIS